ncbi:hypothetical protein L3Q82_009015, partial [Scortum barcoo]
DNKTLDLLSACKHNSRRLQLITPPPAGPLRSQPGPILRPVYTPVVKRQPPNKRRDSLTDCITGYIHFCVETTVPTRRVRCFSNNKPWVTPDLRALLLDHQSGDREEMRRVQRDLKWKIKECARPATGGKWRTTCSKTMRKLSQDTIHPSLLRVKLERAEASDHQLAAWVTNYLTDRPQFVRLQDCVSDVVVCSTGVPPREQSSHLSSSPCTHQTSHTPWTVVHLQKFFRRHCHCGMCVRGERLPLLRTFYEAVVASVVSYAVIFWGGGCILSRDKKRLNRLIKRASSVCGCPLDSIEVMGERRALAKLSTIMDNTSHPLHQTVGALSSSFSNRLRHPGCRKERFH